MGPLRLSWIGRAQDNARSAAAAASAGESRRGSRNPTFTIGFGANLAFSSLRSSLEVAIRADEAERCPTLLGIPLHSSTLT